LYNSNRNQYKELDKFITLTFRHNVNDIVACDYQLKKFIQRLRRWHSVDIQFCGSRELQEDMPGRHALHYHLFLFNCPFTPHEQLLTLWNKDNPFMLNVKGVKSGVHIRAIESDDLNNQTNYLTRYQVKELLDNIDWLAGHKTIVKSRSLLQPGIFEYDVVEYIPEANEIEKAITFIDSNVTYYRLKQ